MPKVCIIGATSDIAIELARIYCEDGYDLLLAARDVEKCKRIFNAFQFPKKIKHTFIYLDVEKEESYHHLDTHLETCQGFVYAAGYLGDKQNVENDHEMQTRISSVNYRAATVLCDQAIEKMPTTGEKWLIGISSVAGERVRPSLKYYAQAKAAFTEYLEKLQENSTRHQTSVLIVKPGIVRTKMVAHLPPKPKWLSAEPSDVARAIYLAQKANKNVIFTPRIWYWIVRLIKLVPGFVLRRT